MAGKILSLPIIYTIRSEDQLKSLTEYVAGHHQTLSDDGDDTSGAYSLLAKLDEAEAPTKIHIEAEELVAFEGALDWYAQECIEHSTNESLAIARSAEQLRKAIEMLILQGGA